MMQTHQAEGNRQGGKGKGEGNRLAKKIITTPHPIVRGGTQESTDCLLVAVNFGWVA